MSPVTPGLTTLAAAIAGAFKSKSPPPYARAPNGPPVAKPRRALIPAPGSA